MPVTRVTDRHQRSSGNKSALRSKAGVSSKSIFTRRHKDTTALPEELYRLHFLVFALAALNTFHNDFSINKTDSDAVLGDAASLLSSEAMQLCNYFY